MSLISPIISGGISSFIRANIEIPATTVTDIVDKTVLRFSVVAMREFAVGGFGESERLLFGGTELF